MTEASNRPTGVDSSVPSVARCYDYALGGKDNYEVDRAAVEAVNQIIPETGLLAKVNRAWHIRATRWLAASAGITQYLDLGAGLPTAENTHEVVQRIDRQARVVYVDNDPSAVAHGQALLDDDDLMRYIAGDLTRPADIMSDKVVTSHLDFTEPIAVYMSGTLHHQPEELGLAGIMKQYVDALPSGSYLVLSHFWDPGGEGSERVHKIRETLLQYQLDAAYFRTIDQIREFFPGLELVPSGPDTEEGLVPQLAWWPDGPVTVDRESIQWCIVGGVGRKP